MQGMSDIVVELISRSEALRRGLALYFTGKPCKRGHVTTRYTKRCACTACYDSHEEKAHRAGVFRAWQATNAARLRHERQERYRNDPVHRAHVLQRNKRWRHNSTARQRRARQRATLWRLANLVQAKFNAKAGKARRRARLHNAEGTITRHDVRAIFAQQQGRCAYCRKRLKQQNCHLDHIVPLARGGSNSPRNLQIACDTCNLQKGANDPIDYARQTGRLL